jgi:pimeloyl-ACP methyl ester carboxylesterase
MDKNNYKIRKRVFLILKILLVVILFATLIILIILPPIMMKDMLNIHVNFKKTYEASEFGLSDKKLVLTTSDGFDIAAYEVAIDNPKAVIIMISGIHNPSVTAFYGHAKLFKEHGYASILYDMRSHGESEGNTICLGYKEVLDTQAVVDYITTQEIYKDIPIIVFGISMGGATAINSIGEIDEIDGLISSSAYASWDDVFYDYMIDMGAPTAYAWLQQPFVKLYSNFKYGFNTAHITPEKEIQKLGERPALLMHTYLDNQVPFQNFKRIMKQAPTHVETWEREGNHHFIIRDEDFLEPEKDAEYTNKILGFLNKYFGDMM